MFNRLYKNLPLVNFFISTSALTFQVAVLYPWHKDISLQLDKLTKQIK